MIAGLVDLPVGELAAVAAVPLVWGVGARLGLPTAARAAGVVFWAVGAGAVGLAGADAVDGRAAALLALAALLAVGGRLRAVAAVAACAAAVAVAPVVGVALAVLAGGLLITGDLGRRLPPRLRRAAGAVLPAVALGGVAAVGTALGTAVGAAVPAPAVEGWGFEPAVIGLAALAWAGVVTRLLWRRLRWLRPAGVAAAVLLASAVLLSLVAPVAGATALLAGVAALAPLTAVLVDEYPALLARRSLIVAAALVSAGAVALAPTASVGSGAVPDGAVPTRDGAVPQAPGAAVAAGPQLTVGESAAAAVVPVTLRIPALGLAGDLGELTVDPGSGELLAPDDPAVAGWFAQGPVPGAVGPAVIGGHVDSRQGPGVFAGLATLRPGDRVEVGLSDGATARFVVQVVDSVPKERFPTADVHGPTPRPELRLVTCGGRFDHTERSYDANVVIEAVLLTRI